MEEHAYELRGVGVQWGLETYTREEKREMEAT
jgi:hypothetical protein